MTNENVWWINIVCNTGLGIVLIGVLKFFLDRYIKQVDERFNKQDRIIESLEKNKTEKFHEIDKELTGIKYNYLKRFEDLKEHFTEKIEDVVKDKNSYRLTITSAISKLEAYYNNIIESINSLRNAK